MKNILVIAAVVVILVLAIGYVIRSKKKGSACIGCPNKLILPPRLSFFSLH